MLGQQAQSLELKYHRLEVSYRWILVVALIALVALGGFVAWTAFDRLGQPDGEQLATDANAAWSTNDPTLLGTLYADDAVLVSAGGATYKGLDAIKSLSSLMATEGFTPEVIGPVIQTGDTVVAPMHLGWVNPADDTWETIIFTLNDDGKIVRQANYGKP